MSKRLTLDDTEIQVIIDALKHQIITDDYSVENSYVGQVGKDVLEAIINRLMEVK